MPISDDLLIYAVARYSLNDPRLDDSQRSKAAEDCVKFYQMNRSSSDPISKLAKALHDEFKKSTDPKISAISQGLCSAALSAIAAYQNYGVSRKTVRFAVMNALQPEKPGSQQYKEIVSAANRQSGLSPEKMDVFMADYVRTVMGKNCKKYMESVPHAASAMISVSLLEEHAAFIGIMKRRLMVVFDLEKTLALPDGDEQVEMAKYKLEKLDALRINASQTGYRMRQTNQTLFDIKTQAEFDSAVAEIADQIENYQPHPAKRVVNWSFQKHPFAYFLIGGAAAIAIIAAIARGLQSGGVYIRDAQSGRSEQIFGIEMPRTIEEGDKLSNELFQQLNEKLSGPSFDLDKTIRKDFDQFYKPLLTTPNMDNLFKDTENFDFNIFK